MRNVTMMYGRFGSLIFIPPPSDASGASSPQGEPDHPALSIQVENEDKGNHAAGHQLSKLGELSRSD